MEEMKVEKDCCKKGKRKLKREGAKIRNDRMIREWDKGKYRARKEIAFGLSGSLSFFTLIL